MAEAKAIRMNPLDGCKAAGPGVQVEKAAPSDRLSLRAGEKAVAALSKALGVSLPRKPLTTASSASRTALWLGPDEWLVIDKEGSGLLDSLSKSKTLHSAVDISHRNNALILSGAGAESTLNAGCPLDLSLAAFPVGACTRTVFGKAEVVLWRTGETEFRVEFWRSFSDYVFGLAEEAARDAAA